MADIKNQNDQPAQPSARPRPTSRSPKLLALIISGALLTLAVYKVLTNDAPWLFRPTTDTDWKERTYWCSRRPKPVSGCPLPTTRYDIDTGFAACYPSSGGIWMTELDPLVLKYLDIPRFESTERSWDQDEEDRFCDRLRPFGGSWYSPNFANYIGLGGECSTLDEWAATFDIDRAVGFPETGGVWVLSYTGTDYGRFARGEDEWEEDEPYFKGVGLARNALTMEERCMALEMSGAFFCEYIETCAELGDLRKEPWELAEEKGIDWKDEARCNCDPGV